LELVWIVPRINLKMDIPTVWVVLLAIASPVAGVVGFAIQLRQVKKTRLENEKLQLAISIIKREKEVTERRIVQATNQEIQKISHPDRVLFSRSSVHEVTSEVTSPVQEKSSLKEKAIVIGFLGASTLVLIYLVYDMYRVILWIVAKLQ
jgi:hypothetical protein